MRARSLVAALCLSLHALLGVAGAGSRGSAPQEAPASPAAAAVESELARVAGLKKAIVVVEGSDATLWAFFGSGIKSTAGSGVTLKKNAPFASSKGQAPTGAMAAAITPDKKDGAEDQSRVASKEEIAERLIGEMQGHGRGRPWGGYWFGGRAGQPGAIVAGVSGYVRREQSIEVVAVLRVVDKE